MHIARTHAGRHKNKTNSTQSKYTRTCAYKHFYADGPLPVRAARPGGWVARAYKTPARIVLWHAPDLFLSLSRSGILLFYAALRVSSAVALPLYLCAYSNCLKHKHCIRIAASPHKYETKKLVHRYVAQALTIYSADSIEQPHACLIARCVYVLRSSSSGWEFMLTVLCACCCCRCCYTAAMLVLLSSAPQK